MWLKVTILLAYILLLFVLSRILEALSWYENGYSRLLSHQLLDPMALSVAKLRALLEQRGVSYEGVVEKSELTNLVHSSGHVSVEEVVMAQAEAEDATETNFTCGAHFIEQVEDAKDSVWLVQVVKHSGQLRIVSDMRWKALRKKISKFGVRTGLLDCSLDHSYCSQKGWHSPILLLALPSEFEKKASIAMHDYSGPIHETVVMRWVRDKLAERVVKITEPAVFQQQWQNFTTNPLDPEIRAVLFTQTSSPPLFYSALTVKFPGRVKFGIVSIKSETKKLNWKQTLGVTRLPSYVVFSTEKNYTYGSKPGEQFSFSSMERFLRFLYPCLNDIFIASFFAANVMSLFEFFVSNCGIVRRATKCVWCIIKYNIIVIMLWLPIMGLFQMPFLDKVPLLALKFERTFSTSQLGTIFRGDFSFFQNHPAYVYLSFLVYLVSVTYLCSKYRQPEEEPEGWFTFGPPAHLVHLRPNNLLEPMGLSRYDFLARLDVLGFRLAPQSLWLQPAISMEYIQHLHTWRFCPRPISEKAIDNVKNVEKAMGLVGTACSPNAPSKMTQDGVTVKSSGFNAAHNDCDVEGAKMATPKGTPQEPLRSNDVYSSGQRSVSCTVVSAREIGQQGFVSDTGLAISNACSQILPGTDCAKNLYLTAENPPQYSGCRQSEEGSQISQEESRGSTSTHSNMSEGPTPTADNLFPNLPSASDVSVSNASSSVDVIPGTSTSDMSPNQSEACASTRSSALSAQTSVMGFPAGYIESHQCVICLEEYSPMVMLCGLPCGHVFHETCIITWLNREKHFCPMCRWPSNQIPSLPHH